LISIIFKSKFKKSGNENHILLAIDFANLITTNKTMGFFLGIVPYGVIILLYLQLLHGTNAQVVGFLISGFIFYTVGLVSVYIYKHTLQLNYFFKNYKEISSKNITKVLSDELSNNSKITNSASSLWGLLLIFISIWILLAAVTLSLQPEKWETVQSLFTALFSVSAILNYIHFITISFAVAGTGFIVKYFYWDKRENINDANYDGYSNNGYSAYSKKLSATLAFVFTIPQPLFFGLSVFVPEGPAKSYLFFGMTFIVLALTMFLFMMLYENIRKNKFDTVTYSFYMLLIIFTFITIKDQNAFGFATKPQMEKLAIQFEQEAAGHELENAASGIDGKAIYTSKCMACHAFDQKLVGPPHKEVLLKYKNNKAAMVKFVLNPVKVRPDYPQMPAQGLKPKEAQAVVDFMFKEYGDKLR